MSEHASEPPSDDGADASSDDATTTTRRASVGAMSGAGFPTHGARLLLDGSGTMFRVFAPTHDDVQLVIYAPGEPAPNAPPPTFGLTEQRRVRMSKSKDGFHVATASGVFAGARYAFVVDGEGPFPDVASRHQPFGPHGPSEVVDPAAHAWRDEGWRGRALEELVIYEVHVGTATREGTFRALVGELDRIAALGVTAIEIMPVGEFPGARNWGYDGTFLFAPAHVYGRPEDLAALVDEAHARGLAVILDVVYNHLGPDGNYFRTYFPGYFTDRHKTPWGDALNYDGDDAGALRAMITENVEHWIRDHHFDGLRLDATHAIVDEGPRHILRALADRARACAGEREVVIIAEDERNEAKVVREANVGGLGLDGVWADDFHHEVRRIVGGDDEGYFADFAGTTSELVKILQKGWLYEGQPSKVHGKPRGTPVLDVPPPRLVHCLQNHDQIGNRAKGDRLHHVVPANVLRAATALLLSTPYTPLLFMGQEFGASSPFQYFTDHKPDLGKLVTEGRRNEFKAFRAFADAATRASIPDPQAAETFERSKLDVRESEKSPGKELVSWHRALLALRRESAAMKNRRRADVDVVQAGDELICVRRRARDDADASLLFVVCLRGGGGEVRFDAHEATSPRRAHAWRLVLDSEEARFGGAGGNATLESQRVVLRGPGAVVLEG